MRIKNKALYINIHSNLASIGKVSTLNFECAHQNTSIWSQLATKLFNLSSLSLMDTDDDTSHKYGVSCLDDHFVS